MVIIQMVRKIRILFHYSIKRPFNLILNKLGILLSLSLLSCSINLIQAEEIKPQELYCGSTTGQFLKNENNYITAKSENFNEMLDKINSNFIDKGYNLIVVSGLKPTGGFSLKLKNINKKKDTIYMNFINIVPDKNSKVIMAATYPYCVLKINNLDKFKVSVEYL